MALVQVMRRSSPSVQFPRGIWTIRQESLRDPNILRTLRCIQCAFRKILLPLDDAFVGRLDHVVGRQRLLAFCRMKGVRSQELVDGVQQSESVKRHDGGKAPLTLGLV
jgi:hypothetical protein